MGEIVDVILQRATVPTIAVVRDAFSAGALIAMSAEQLVMLPGSSIGAALPVVLDPLAPLGLSPADEKIQSAMRAQFRSVALARGRNADVAEAMVSPREIPGLTTAQELVTLSATQAVQHGIADLEARTLREALEQLGYGGVTVQRLEPTMLERAAQALTSPLVAAILLAIGVIGILIELFTPGVGAPGAIGILALLLFFGGAFIATPAGLLDLVLVIAGIILIAVELLFLPGFGIAGILGLGALLFALFRIFQEGTVYVVGYTALFGGLLLALTFWLLPNVRLGRALMLSTRLKTEVSSTVSSTATGSSAQPTTGFDHLLGQQGVATSDLRPAGVARFGAKRVDVVTEGEFITKGAVIEVLLVEGNRVTVRAVEE
jgi:membrane-bound serine protease (ClpP class)